MGRTARVNLDRSMLKLHRASVHANAAGYRIVRTHRGAACGGWRVDVVGFGTYQDQQTYKGVLSSAVSELSGTDELLAEIDAVVVDLANSDVTSLSVDDMLDVQKRVQDGKSACIDELDAAEEAVGQVAINSSSEASNAPV